MAIKCDVRPFPRRVMRRMACQDFLQFYEGPVRSGKTLSSLLAWLIYLESNPVSHVMMSGDSLGSIYRNLLGGNYGLLSLCPGSYTTRKDNCNAVMLPTSHGMVTAYLFGAANAGSDEPIRGVTVEGWYADEITLHHPDFVAEALARTAISPHRVNIWTSNPEDPDHYIYTQYTDRFRAMSPQDRADIGGYHEFHFSLEDNPVLTPERVRQLSSQFTGHELERKIYGRRVKAEGLVYGSIDLGTVFRSVEGKTFFNLCGIDFGIDHPTAMVFGGSIVGRKGCYYIQTEFYPTDAQRKTWTVADYCDEFVRICEDRGVKPSSVRTAIDPGGGGKALIREFQRRGLHVLTADKPVLNGIAFLSRMLSTEALIIHPSCVNIRREMGLYSWNTHASPGKTEPLKRNDDALDALRYLAYTLIEPAYRGTERAPKYQYRQAKVLLNSL
ncbi:MAG: terminase family protein [Gudongella sp.]|jgi:PBSX family phage terminase large subunit|nr:terminase family protein [Gudongella sp.]